MTKAVVDPEELRRFASELKRFNSELKQEIAGLHHRFARLGDTWQDQEHLKFADQFEKIRQGCQTLGGDTIAPSL